MPAKRIVHTDRLKEMAPSLCAGDIVLLSGTVYTARDAAHKAIFAMLDRDDPPPFDMAGATIYYAGPTQAPPGKPIGSCGPTTSGRMDVFSPRLLDMGLAGMIGKGERSKAVVDAMVRNGAVYFNAVGGAAALISRHITQCEEIAFPELGCESIKRLTIERLPLVVAIDSRGNNLFETGRRGFATAD